MIELTQKQRRELKQPEPVAIDPETKEQYVLVQKEVYERLRSLFGNVASLGKQDVVALIHRAMREYDLDDPTLDLYQID